MGSDLPLNYMNTELTFWNFAISVYDWELYTLTQY